MSILICSASNYNLRNSPGTALSRTGNVIFPHNEDGRVLASIAASGMDMAQPISFEFAISSRDKEMSDAINHALISVGYASTVYFDEGESDFTDVDDEEFGPSWTVYVLVVIIPSYENVIQIQNELNQLVEPLEGKVDGWEVKLEK